VERVAAAISVYDRGAQAFVEPDDPVRTRSFYVSDGLNAALELNVEPARSYSRTFAGTNLKHKATAEREYKVYRKLVARGVTLPAHELYTFAGPVTVDSISLRRFQSDSGSELLLSNSSGVEHVLARSICRYSFADVAGYCIEPAQQSESLREFSRWASTAGFHIPVLDCAAPSILHRAATSQCTCELFYRATGYYIHRAYIAARDTWTSMDVQGVLTPDNVGFDGSIFDFEDLIPDTTRTPKSLAPLRSFYHLAWGQSGLHYITEAIYPSGDLDLSIYEDFALFGVHGFVEDLVRPGFGSFLSVLFPEYRGAFSFEAAFQSMREGNIDALALYLAYRMRYDANKPGNLFLPVLETCCECGKGSDICACSVQHGDVELPMIGDVRYYPIPDQHLKSCDALLHYAVPRIPPNEQPFEKTVHIGSYFATMTKKRKPPYIDTALQERLSSLYGNIAFSTDYTGAEDVSHLIKYALPLQGNGSVDFSKFENSITPSFTDGQLCCILRSMYTNLKRGRDDQCYPARSPLVPFENIRYSNTASAGIHLGKGAIFRSLGSPAQRVLARRHAHSLSHCCERLH